jgi:Domain of unknown function (DUF4340)
VDAPLNWKVTLGFLVVLAVLSGVVVGLDRFKVGAAPSATEATQAAQISVLKFDDQKVTAIELKAGAGDATKSVRVEKNPETKTWTIAGTGEAANSASFSSLLFRMASLTATSRVAGAGADLSQYGLDQPKDQVTAELDDGTKPTLLLGNKTPVGSGTYAKTADADDVYVIASQFSSDVERLANDPKQPPTPTPRPATPTPPAPDTTATPAA